MANLSAVVDFIAFVVLYGPDSFPEWRQMTMNRAFSTLRDDLESLNLIGTGTSNQRVEQLLDRAELAYKEARIVDGAHLLQDLMSEIRVRPTRKT